MAVAGGGRICSSAARRIIICLPLVKRSKLIGVLF
jgi:hypothetical protein